MSKLKCGLIQMSLKGDGTMAPEKIRDLMIEAHIPMLEDAAKQGVKVLCFQEVFTSPYFCPSQDKKWYAAAESIPDGPTIKLMQEYAKKYQMVIVVPIYVFVFVSYLLIYGELPSKKQLKKFENKIKNHTLVHEDFKSILEGFPSMAHPMGIMSSLITSLTAFYPESLDPSRSKGRVELSIIRILAKFPTFVAWSFKKRNGHPIVYPDNKLDYCSNFLKMMFQIPSEDYEVNPIVSDALDKLLILHADHEQNCSTSTVRIVGSSLSSIYASISAGINALWGSLHGGANQAVIEMLEKVRKDGSNIKKYISKAKDKDDSFRLMGFGHRVYKNFDPRAKIIKKQQIM